jgi:hypothetical protein
VSNVAGIPTAAGVNVEAIFNSYDKNGDGESPSTHDRLAQYSTAHTAPVQFLKPCHCITCRPGTIDVEELDKLLIDLGVTPTEVGLILIVYVLRL